MGAPEDDDTAGHGSAARRSLVRDLGEVAAWWTASHGEVKLSEVFRCVPAEGMPPSVLEAFERLREATVREFAIPERVMAYDSVARLQAAVLGFDDRVRDVLLRRAGHDPETLDAIGGSHQLTRERIRQLEEEGKRAVDELLSAYPEVMGRLPALRAKVVPIFNDELLDEAVVAIFPGFRTCDSGTADLFRSFILRHVGDLRSWREGWSAPRELLPVLWDARRGSYDGHTPRSLLERLQHTDRSVVSTEVLLDLLGLSDVSGCLWRQPVSLPARAVVQLESEGAPLAFDVLCERLGPAVNRQSLRNALMGEERIVRTDRDVFALAAWGYSTYESIADMVARHLHERGGHSTLEAVVDDLTSRFSVAASSVRAYARSHRFVLEADGNLRARADDEPVTDSLRPLRNCLGCVRIGGRWAFRVRVDEQILRGFSAAVPASFAARLGVKPLENRVLPGEHGAIVSVTRKGLNPMIGRIRSVAERLGLGPGSLLFIIEPDERVGALAFVGFDAQRLEKATPRERAGLELGLEPPFELQDVLRALDLDEDETSRTALALLRARGEAEAVDVLEVERSPVSDGPSSDDVARLLGL